jgi:GNAT superfamily N-acetyltransferase
MLDKTVEYKNIIMRLDGYIPEALSEPRLPPGFSFRFFTPSDAERWGEIKASVLEFDSAYEASVYFKVTYMPHLAELRRRCVFVADPSGVPVATATAWYADSELGHQACLHWVSVHPEYQGRGLGRAVVKKALAVFRELETGNPVWLHTQTWSHVAVRLYHSLGFNLVREGKLASTVSRSGKPKIYDNDFEEALAVLKGVMDEEYVRELARTAVEPQLQLALPPVIAGLTRNLIVSQHPKKSRDFIHP